MPAPVTTETAPTSERTTTAVDNSANLAAQQAQGGLSSVPPQGAQPEKSKTKEEIDQEYEERMEDEYAKREGGA